jgi:signal transduction histidine kinase
LRFVSEAGPAVVEADRVALEQALNNLVVNAIEAIDHAGGEVIVRVGRGGGVARLSVDDNGPGISAELGDRMFDVFETTKARGMGLGLPLTKQIAERHGGRLTWRSRLPRGTRFEIELPSP